MVYHLMYSDDWSSPKPCSSCSFWLDSLSGSYPHIKLSGKAELAVVCDASYDKLKAAADAKGWPFPVASAAGTTFGSDFKVSFTEEEMKEKAYNYGRPVFCPKMPGGSVFYRSADGTLYHTYSVYARGMEPWNSVRVSVLGCGCPHVLTPCVCVSWVSGLGRAGHAALRPGRGVGHGLCEAQGGVREVTRWTPGLSCIQDPQYTVRGRGSATSERQVRGR